MVVVTLARFEPLRRTAEITTRALTDNLTQVSNADRVLGFVRTQWNGYAALRGTHLASAQEVGCYATHGLALEALRQRPRTI
ncbi:hypothetical protein GCM10025867_34890 [Frondihabitans sucicola]|uniref:Uncharacterized protein n=1 Tax=Frondihabitans sucicola TaxID=1268041 RepID=A0ABN6Y6S6_9MICO|nr:hypothetical protein GCM10025867_34890 [Frondihabitans sucicola]